MSYCHQNSCLCEFINDKANQIEAVVIYKMNFSSKIEFFNKLIRSMKIDLDKEMPTFKLLIEDLKKCRRLSIDIFWIGRT